MRLDQHPSLRIEDLPDGLSDRLGYLSEVLQQTPGLPGAAGHAAVDGDKLPRDV